MKQEFLACLPEQVNIKGYYDFENSVHDIMLDGDLLDPRLSQKIDNHSPDGFNWGYGGSGPAQLALAILLEYLPIKYACELKQNFKWAYIAHLPQRDFDVTINLREIIQTILEKQKAEENL